MGYVIRPGFLSAGLMPKSEEQEERLARPYFPVGMSEADEGDQTLALPRTYRTIALASDIQEEHDLREQFAPRHRPEPNPTLTPMPPIRWRRGMPRPLGLDDDVPVSAPEIGGLSHMWSTASTLARSLSDHLQSLRSEYIEGTPAEEGSKWNTVEQLINRFESDKKALEHVRKVCMRTYYINALHELPPYYDAVLTLRTRLNFWLTAWNTHKERKQGHQTGNENRDRGDRVKNHLKEWLDEVDKLPKYPEEMPLYVEPNAPLIMPLDCLLSKPKPDEKPGQWPNENEVLDPLDLRTPSRRVYDHQARQRDICAKQYGVNGFGTAKGSEPHTMLYDMAYIPGRLTNLKYLQDHKNLSGSSPRSFATLRSGKQARGQVGFGASLSLAELWDYHEGIYQGERIVVGPNVNSKLPLLVCISPRQIADHCPNRVVPTPLSPNFYVHVVFDMPALFASSADIGGRIANFPSLFPDVRGYIGAE
ncbi:hypothetical protein CONLIGDRAFT_703730 [Coniochaeta ligniaria NRRL 30616]|uniref:Uncharacterized protein n=1 Tax=Coniochaeta ligniaria NRRL 30616 TaxID=1408157 RepID=A0A1J7JLQ6_9PEZI|nr:hypothetical protein CONLIGDRAFT_703730 [Coniochaeta ligniaria NRRL 30616]